MFPVLISLYNNFLLFLFLKIPSWCAHLGFWHSNFSVFALVVLDLLGVPVKLCLATFPECRCEFWGVSELFRTISMIPDEGNRHFQSACIPAVTLICRICSNPLEAAYFTVLFSIMGSKCHCCSSLQVRLIALWSDFSSRGKWTGGRLALRLKSC